MLFFLQVKQQTVKERQQAELRLEEAHQAEENAMAQLQTLRRECRQVLTLLCWIKTIQKCCGVVSGLAAEGQAAHCYVTVLFIHNFGSCSA